MVPLRPLMAPNSAARHTAIAGGRHLATSTLICISTACPPLRAKDKDDTEGVEGGEGAAGPAQLPEGAVR